MIYICLLLKLIYSKQLLDIMIKDQSVVYITNKIFYSLFIKVNAEFFCGASGILSYNPSKIYQFIKRII